MCYFAVTWGQFLGKTSAQKRGFGDFLMRFIRRHSSTLLYLRFSILYYQIFILSIKLMHNADQEISANLKGQYAAQLPGLIRLISSYRQSRVSYIYMTSMGLPTI